ncbi:MAG: hypothetical protein ACYC9J_11575 [Sulfuricaulis sp.]
MAIVQRQEAAAIDAFFINMHGSAHKRRGELRKRLLTLAHERPEKVERFAEMDPALDDETSKLLCELLNSLRKVRLN